VLENLLQLEKERSERTDQRKTRDERLDPQLSASVACQTLWKELIL
jgi:hypothetical protein